MVENNHQKGGFEPSDVDVWSVGKFAIGLVALCLISVLLLFGLFHFFLSAEGGKSEVAAKFPPSPQLQITPRKDLEAYREAQDNLLKSYGWVDQQKGIVRIPVSRAIDMLAQKGLPARTPAEAQSQANIVTVPTESGLGAKMMPAGGPLAGESK